MVSKKAKIQEMTEAGASVDEIREEVDTSAGYVYKVRSETSSGAATSVAGPEGEDLEELTEAQEESVEEMGELLDEEAEGDLEEALDDAPTESTMDAADDELEQLDDEIVEDDLPNDDGEELDLDDDGAKTYECGECDATVEYLDRRCGGCGEQLMWSHIEAQ